MHNKIIKTLCDNGYNAHIVGGAVRDILLGENPKDIDIVTNAIPEQIISLFPENKIDLVGANFQVVMIDGIEVATYRFDCYDGFNLAETVVASTINEDLSRRDLTINSLAMCPVSGDIIDLFGGINDLKNRIIKFTGNPNDRIKEDPCRILRACRFLAKIDGELDEETEFALLENRHLVKNIAPERIRIEIMKLMNCKNPSLFFEIASDIGILELILPNLDFCLGFDGGPHHEESVFQHCMIAGDSISNKFPLLKLAGYLHDIGKYQSSAYDEEGFITFHGHEKIGSEIVEQELKALKFSNDEIEYIKNLVEFHMRSLKDISPRSMRRLISKMYEKNISHKDFLRLKIADRKANLKKEPFTFQEIKHMVKLFQIEFNAEIPNAFSIKDLTIDGNDVIQIFAIKQGPIVGNILKDIFEMVLDDPELNEREMLLVIVEGRKCRTL